MQPEQMRAARAALNWSLERLADASGVHRNTLSNFETRKYVGDPDKLAAVRHALEEAGVIFIEENGQAAGARLRRFQPGDLVRFRPQTRVRFDYSIGANEVGTVTGVEPHPPQTGPTYRIEVQFERVRVPYVFRFEYELVKPAPAAPELTPPERQDSVKMDDPAAIIEEFCVICESVRNDYDLYRTMFEEEQRTLDLYSFVAPLCFHGWQKLRDVNDRMQAFRKRIEPARSKRIAHVDLPAQLERWDNLGAFPEGAEKQFLQDLQDFIDIAYGHFHAGRDRPIVAAMNTDSHQLIRALGKSVVFDRCPNCDEAQRANAILDYEDRPT